MTTPAGLTETMLSISVRIFRKYPVVREVRLYGSRALGTFTPQSDIDYAVFGDDVDRQTVARMIMDFDDSDIPVEVDLHAVSEIRNDALMDHIQRVGVSVFQREE
jgi:uncharacterized protein